ncbi:type II toxin-antitoxin system Phd/YefM family antitoxin [Hoeflea sp. CAU 1731]
MKAFRSSGLKQHVGDVLHAAETAPVAITKHDKLRYVLMSAEQYERRIRFVSCLQHRRNPGRHRGSACLRARSPIGRTRR